MVGAASNRDDREDEQHGHAHQIVRRDGPVSEIQVGPVVTWNNAGRGKVLWAEIPFVLIIRPCISCPGHATWIGLNKIGLQTGDRRPAQEHGPGGGTASALKYERRCPEGLSE